MYSVVIIAEKRILYDNVNLFSNELDFSSENVTNGILAAFKNKGIHTYYYSSPKEFLDHIKRHQNDVVFSALWGGYHSRNKRSLIAAICEAYQICYVGADAFVQALCQDKYLTKSYLKDFSFNVPCGILISSQNDLQLLDGFSAYPCIVKPNDEGSSVGVSDYSIAYNHKDAKMLVKNLLPHYTPVLVEQFISGKEISICCAGAVQPDLLEAVQLIVNENQELDHPWGYESKKAGKSMVSRKIVTDEIPASILTECRHLFKSLGKVDLMRIDGKLYHGSFYVIELSPDCSLHKTCFMTTAFEHNGYTYDEMLLHLAQTSWESFHV